MTTEWTSYSFSVDTPNPGLVYVASVYPTQPFRLHWLLIVTPGVSVKAVKLGKQDVLLDAAPDLYLISHWDWLAKLEQLDRVRLTGRIRGVGETIRIDVQSQQMPRVYGAFVGESGTPSNEDVFREVLAAQREALAAQPKPAPVDMSGARQTECRECGAVVGEACFGARRGEFHKSRKVK